jgi:MoxR-like ATPase
MTAASTPEQVHEFSMRFDELVGNIETFIRGKRSAVRHALVCLFAEGHLLVEDVPGVAKTSLARAIAQSVTATVHRIQFTPDLLPSDITGVRIWDARAQEFRFEEGPVFANIVIADEINRASPKTQSALLEVMAERQVTVAGEARPVRHPFLCVATLLAGVALTAAAPGSARRPPPGPPDPGTATGHQYRRAVVGVTRPGDHDVAALSCT